MRSLNEAMTRARAGVVVVGGRKTSTAQSSGDADVESKAAWKSLLEHCEEVSLLGK